MKKWTRFEIFIALFLVAMLVILLGGVGLVAWNWNPQY